VATNVQNFTKIHLAYVHILPKPGVVFLDTPGIYKQCCNFVSDFNTYGFLALSLLGSFTPRCPRR